MKRPRFLAKLDHNRSEILKGASVTLPLKVLGTVFGFLLNLFIARMIGAEGTGIYYLTLTIVTVATIAARLGMDNVLLRVTAAGAATRAWPAVKGVSVLGLRIALVGSVALAVVLVGGARFMAEVVFDKPELTAGLRWMGPAVIPISLYFLYAMLLQGLKKIAAGIFVLMVGQPFFTLLLLWPCVHLSGTGGIMRAYLIGATMTCLCGYFAWKRCARHLAGVPAAFDRRELMRSSLPLLWVSSSFFVMNWMSTFFLGLSADAGEVGIFRVAERTAALLTFFLIAINSMASPKFAELYRNNRLKELTGLVRWASGITAVAALPFFIVMAAFSAPIMGIYGADFRSGAAVLVIIAGGQYVNCATGPIGTLLVMCAREVSMRNAMLIGAAANIAVNLALTSRYGMRGAAVASAMGQIAMNLACLYMAHKKLGVWPLPTVGLLPRPIAKPAPPQQAE